eukprot:360870-Chlamydomonas_euryale.AAC.32
MKRLAHVRPHGPTLHTHAHTHTHTHTHAHTHAHSQPTHNAPHSPTLHTRTCSPSKPTSVLLQPATAPAPPHIVASAAAASAAVAAPSTDAAPSAAAAGLPYAAPLASLKSIGADRQSRSSGCADTALECASSCRQLPPTVTLTPSHATRTRPTRPRAAQSRRYHSASCSRASPAHNGT